MLSAPSNSIDFAFLSTTFPPLGLTFLKLYLKFVSSSFFALITYALPLIDLIEVYRIKFFVIKKKKRVFHTFRRCYQIAQSTKQTHFFGKF
jgi:hypothetical protein